MSEERHSLETPINFGVRVRLIGVVHLYPSPDGEVVALRGVELDVAGGESVALLGPSGAGKSTVLSLIAGEFTPSAGSVLIGDVDITRVGPEAIAALRASKISLVVQGSQTNLLSYTTARENIWFAQHGARRRGGSRLQPVDELIDLFDLTLLADVPVEQMSSGERQRVALVAGTAVLPRLLLIDEPTSQLNSEDHDRVIDTIVEIHGRLGMTVVVVTHDPEVAAKLERTITIRDGRVGSVGQAGQEFALVGQDGSLHLPPDVFDLLPPGSRVSVVRRGEELLLQRADDSGETT